VKAIRGTNNEETAPAVNETKKATALDWAEILDAFRVFPRIYLGFLLYVIWDLHVWYLEHAENPNVYAPLAFGCVSAVFGFYMGSGRKWGG
jgi:hypothetical protein